MAQSIGPFKNIITRSIAKYIFNHAELITVRDPITFEYIKNFLNKNIEPIQTADIAFLLQPEIDFKKMNLRDSYPVWGISMSQIISRWAFPDIEDSKKKYKLFEINYPDILWENRPVLQYHKFKTVTNAPRIRIYKVYSEHNK